MPENMGLWLHFAPAAMMLIIFALNITFLQKRTKRRSAEESDRLRIAISAELRGLADLYRANLRLLRTGRDYLLSTRSAAPVYRGNLGRLVLLDCDAIQRVVRVHAKNESIELHLASRARTTKSGSAHIYRFEPNDSEVNDFKKMYSEGLIRIEATCRVLGSEEPEATQLNLSLTAKREQFPRTVAQNQPSPTEGITVGG